MPVYPRSVPLLMSPVGAEAPPPTYQCENFAGFFSALLLLAWVGSGAVAAGGGSRASTTGVWTTGGATVDATGADDATAAEPTTEEPTAAGAGAVTAAAATGWADGAGEAGPATTVVGALCGFTMLSPSHTAQKCTMSWSE